MRRKKKKRCGFLKKSAEHGSRKSEEKGQEKKLFLPFSSLAGLIGQALTSRVRSSQTAIEQKRMKYAQLLIKKGSIFPASRSS